MGPLFGGMGPLPRAGGSYLKTLSHYLKARGPYLEEGGSYLQKLGHNVDAWGTYLVAEASKL